MTVDDELRSPHLSVVHTDTGSALGSLAAVSEFAGLIETVDDVTVLVLAALRGSGAVALDTETGNSGRRRRCCRDPLDGRKATGNSVDLVPVSLRGDSVSVDVEPLHEGSIVDLTHSVAEEVAVEGRLKVTGEGHGPEAF